MQASLSPAAGRALTAGWWWWGGSVCARACVCVWDVRGGEGREEGGRGRRGGRGGVWCVVQFLNPKP